MWENYWKLFFNTNRYRMKSACKYAVMMNNYCRSQIFRISGVNRIFIQKWLLHFDNSGILNFSVLSYELLIMWMHSVFHQQALVLCKFGKAVERQNLSSSLYPVTVLQTDCFITVSYVRQNLTQKIVICINLPFPD